MDAGTSTSHPYTCLACALAFTSASLQREHYSSDLHRYNAKRKVAGLAPVSASSFDSKVEEQHRQDGQQRRCDACGKAFVSQGAEKSHLASKKHREAVFKAANRAIDHAYNPASPSSSQPPAPRSEKPLDELIASRLESAKSVGPLASPSTSCLFCPTASPSLDANLDHMLGRHGFFVPDRAFLVDPEGLLRYLAEAVTAWGSCVFCGAEFAGDVGEEGAGEAGVKRGLDRVRKHMIDKSHCKIAWDTEPDRLQVSDYYDFRPSYPAVEGGADDGDSDWEDASSTSSSSLPDDGDGFMFGDSPFELVLPSGKRIGHRALRHIYKSNVVPYAISPSSASSPANRLISRLAIAHSSSPSSSEEPSDALSARLSHAARTGSLASASLVPAKGGLGAFGQGRAVVKARNKGEAKEAGRATKEFHEGKQRQRFATRVGIKVGNNQKHYRDPLLQ